MGGLALLLVAVHHAELGHLQDREHYDDDEDQEDNEDNEAVRAMDIMKTRNNVDTVKIMKL